MEENASKQESVEQSKQDIQRNAAGLWENIKTFLVELLDFRHDTDQSATIQAIKSDIPFKGATAWILIFAVFVASVGLNANSTPVVIGAMLISPLMGPILGVGMSIAINDIDTLRKSMINLATMIVLSLIASFLFFYLFPFNEDNSELLGRTKPDIRDVLIAFFGGLALMVARTKKGTIASVIFGVAIATALMPPLCTAGYGLSQGNWKYFLGAMYLFLINTIFIALATFLVLKLLRFPMLRYANSLRRKRIAQLASLTAIVVMVPAVWTFLNVIKESGYQRDYAQFLEKEINSNNNLWLQREKMDMEKKTITLFFNGEINDATVTDLNNEVKFYNNIKDFELVIDGNKTRSFDKLSESLDRAYNQLDEKENIIEGLQQKIGDLEQTILNLNTNIEEEALKRNEKAVAFSRISKDAKLIYAEIEQLEFANVLSTKDFIKIDTIPRVTVTWNASVNDSIITVKEIALRTWLQTQMELDTLFIKRDQ